MLFGISAPTYQDIWPTECCICLMDFGCTSNIHIIYYNVCLTYIWYTAIYQQFWACAKPCLRHVERHMRPCHGVPLTYRANIPITYANVQQRIGVTSHVGIWLGIFAKYYSPISISRHINTQWRLAGGSVMSRATVPLPATRLTIWSRHLTMYSLSKYSLLG